MENTKQFDTICLSGGGVKGIAFVGVLDYLVNCNFINLDLINNYVGTSAGSMICFLLSIGYSPKEIGDFILDFNFQKIDPDINCETLFEQFGILDPTKLIFIFTHFLKNKFQLSDCTFQELFNLTKKKLSIIGTNYTKGRCEIFNYIETPDMSVILAIRISSSIPLVFVPVFYNDCYYVDGALTNNFPFNICNKETTLGVYVKNAINNSMNSIPGLILNCFGIILDTVSEKDFTEKNLNIIEVRNYQNEMTSFNLDYAKKLKIINLGQKNAKEYVEKLNTRICQSIINDILDSSLNNHKPDTMEKETQTEP